MFSNHPNEEALAIARNDRAFRAFVSREVNKIWDAGIATTCRDQTLSLYANIEQIKNLQPYMRTLIENGAARIFKYRYNVGMLSFSDNEVIMINRLYTDLTRGEYQGEVSA